MHLIDWGTTASVNPARCSESGKPGPRKLKAPGSQRGVTDTVITVSVCGG